MLRFTELNASSGNDEENLSRLESTLPRELLELIDRLVEEQRSTITAAVHREFQLSLTEAQKLLEENERLGQLAKQLETEIALEEKELQDSSTNARGDEVFPQSDNQIVVIDVDDYESEARARAREASKWRTAPSRDTDAVDAPDAARARSRDEPASSTTNVSLREVPKVEAPRCNQATIVSANRTTDRATSSAQPRDTATSIGASRPDQKSPPKLGVNQSENDKTSTSRIENEKSDAVRSNRNEAGSSTHELPTGQRLSTGVSLLVRRTGGTWSVATLREFITREGVLKLKMAFPHSTKVKVVGLRGVADMRSIREADTPIRIGTRVVAPVRQGRANAAGNKALQREWRAGFIGELPNNTNEYRVLVLLECGAAHYARLDELHYVLEQSPGADVRPYFNDANVELTEDTRRFLEFYFTNYPISCRMNVRKGSTITMTDGRSVSVSELRCSMMRVQYTKNPADSEWLHSSSPRIRSIQNEIRKWFESGKKKLETNKKCLRRSTANGAYVETVRRGWQPSDFLYVPSEQAQLQALEQARIMMPANPSTSTVSVSGASSTAGSSGVRLPTARKSTSGAATKDYRRHVEVARAAQKREREQHGKVVWRNDLTVDYALKVGRYSAHAQCGPDCVRDKETTEVLAATRDENPLCVPMRLGWRREVQFDMPIGEPFSSYVTQQGVTKHVLYVAPCGRRLRNITELARYLVETDSHVEPDLFSFCLKDHPFRYFKISKPLYYCDDLSSGRETMPISVVNCLQHDKPPVIEYVTRPYACADVLRPGGLCLDEEFLAGCDCTDNCRDQSKCACQQYTMSNACGADGEPNTEAAYTNKRLFGQVSTGLFECNSRCKCDRRCNNRVVQNGVRLRLQLFRTEWKGWGVRCIDDVPRGAFICTYVGELMRDEAANDQGLDYGDEYLANLDLIELIESEREQNKAGYQSDVSAADRELLDLLAASSSSDENDSESGEQRQTNSRTARGPTDADQQSCTSASDSPSKAKTNSQQIAEHLSNVNGALKKRLLDCIRKVFGGNKQRVRALFDAVRGEVNSKADTIETEQSAAATGRECDEEEALCKEALRLVFGNGRLAPSGCHQASLSPINLTLNAVPSSQSLDDTTKPKSDGSLKTDDAASTSDSDLEASSEREHEPRLEANVVTHNIFEVAQSDGSGSETERRVEKPRVGRPRKSTAGGSALRKYTLLNNTRQQAGNRTEAAAELNNRLNTLKQIVAELRTQSERLISDSENRLAVNNIADRLCCQLQVGASLQDDTNRPSDNDSGVTADKALAPGASTQDASSQTNEKISLRKAAFGDDEPFVMDSRKRGNIGRYLNHSCEPNVFVQNVFIDSHDMRFPVIAFFAYKRIKAGNELCWDYHYPVGQVEGKEIMCYCGAKNCGGRIL